MITQPQDYVLVTPVGKIDGNILPARDVAADGSSIVLHTEDVCFLLEAARRICAYRFSSLEHMAYDLGEPSLVLDVGPVRGSIWGIQEGSVQNGTTTNMRTWPNVPVLKSGSGVITGQGWRYIPDVVQYGTNGIADIWDGCLTSATASAAENFLASTNDFVSGNPLLTNNLRKVFHDLDTVKGIVAQGAAIYSAGATRRSRTWYNGGGAPSDRTSSITPDGRVFNSTRYTNDTFYAADQYDYAWQATGIGNPTSRPDRLAALSPTSCWSLWTVESYVRDGSSGTYLERHVDAYLVDSTIDAAGNILFGVPVTSAGILGLCIQAHGLYDDVWNMPLDTTEDVRASCAGVMFYDSGIDFSSLGWTWP